MIDPPPPAPEPPPPRELLPSFCQLWRLTSLLMLLFFTFVVFSWPPPLFLPALAKTWPLPLPLFAKPLWNACTIRASQSDESSDSLTTSVR